MKPATTIADNGAFSAQKSIFGPEYITIRFRPKNRFLNSPYGPEKSPPLVHGRFRHLVAHNCRLR
ncbi:MAG: hypothetical protein ACK5GN_07460 [Pseudomonadota bacterium]